MDLNLMACQSQMVNTQWVIVPQEGDACVNEQIGLMMLVTDAAQADVTISEHECVQYPSMNAMHPS